jgi:hypothetical protein
MISTFQAGRFVCFSWRNFWKRGIGAAFPADPDNLTVISEPNGEGVVIETGTAIRIRGRPETIDQWGRS